MNPSEAEELLSCLVVLSDSCENLTQRIVAVENTLSQPDRDRYDKELRRLRERGPATNAALVIEALQRKILPDL